MFDGFQGSCNVDRKKIDQFNMSQVLMFYDDAEEAVISGDIVEPLRAASRRSGRTMRSRKKKISGSNPTASLSVVQLSSFTRRSQTITMRSIRLISIELGYAPSNIVDIGASITFDSQAYPTVAVLYPLNANDLGGRYSMEGGYKPFPTTLWMTCPHLHARVSKLEDAGWIQRLYDRLHNSEESAEWIGNMCEAHRRYGEFRWNLLTESDKEFVISNGW